MLLVQRKIMFPKAVLLEAAPLTMSVQVSCTRGSYMDPSLIFARVTRRAPPSRDIISSLLRACL